MPIYVVTSNSELDRVPAPNLPLAPTDWDRRYQDQFANVLRLYFNRLDNFLAKLNASTLPYGAFHQDGVTTLTAGIGNGTTTPIPVTSTAGFPSAGYLLIGDEFIKYTTTTSTTFDGTITRGVLGTSSSAHSLGAYVTEAQATGSSTTSGTLLFSEADYSNGFSIDATDATKLVCSTPAIYNLQFSAQLINYDSDDNVTIWFVLNSVDIPYTASIAEVPGKHGSAPGANILTVNILQELKAGDYIQLKFASLTGNTAVATHPPTTSPVTPASPALIFTATFVSAPAG